MKKRGLSKKLLSYILCLLMVVTLIPANAMTVYAEGGTCPHCGGTGMVCDAHKQQAHFNLEYSNEENCDQRCIINREEDDVCKTHQCYEWVVMSG